jgi:vanillate O-demethylase monooxygenase subunit
MFVRNCWYVAGWNYELPPDSLLARTIIGEPLVLFRRESGDPVALEDRCCHRQAPLSLGRKERDGVQCGYHGLRFDSSGACVEIPGQQIIPPHARVRAYPVVERHSWIWVWMGDPTLADQSLIPPAVGLDDPKWVLREGVIDYDADYLLIGDNLCDFSHLSFVHAATFGQGNLGHLWAAQHPTITRLDRGIRVQRWIAGSTQPVYTNSDGLSDMWSSYDFLAPAVLLMKSLTYPAGTAAACDFKEPTGEPLATNFTSQAVTPMTERTSRYYFSFGPAAPEPFPGLADSMFKLTEAAFAEDKRMIEAQQRNWKEGLRTIGIQHDRGPTMMRQVLGKLAKAEAVSG